MKRRTCLAILGGSTAFLAGCPSLEREPEPEQEPETETPTPDPPETPTEPVEEPPAVEFGTTIDMVEDAGCDPTGEEPCDGAVRDVIADDTRLLFPEGTYRFEEQVDLRETDYERVGFTGDGDVQFVPPTGFNDWLISVIHVDEIVFEEIDIDITESDTTAGLRFHGGHDLSIDSVEFLGRGTHPDEDVVNALSLAVTEEDGTGVARNVVSTEGSAIGHYNRGNGRVGIWVGGNHRGTLSLEECHLEEFGNNAVYASRTAGSTRVRGGYFRNNNVCAVRISGDGSDVDGATIEIDLDEYTGPTTGMDDQVNTRAIVVEQSQFESQSGAEVRNCDIRVRETQFPGPAVHVWPTGKTLTVLNTTIQMDGDSPAIYRAPQEPQGDISPSEEDRWIHVEDVTITGNGDGWSTIGIMDGPNSLIRNCSIEQTGSDRVGIRLARSSNTIIDGGSVQTSTYPLYIDYTEELDPDACIVEFEGTPQFESASLDNQDSASDGQVSRMDGPIPGCISSEFLADHGNNGGLRIVKLNASEVWLRTA